MYDCFHSLFRDSFTVEKADASCNFLPADYSVIAVLGCNTAFYLVGADIPVFLPRGCFILKKKGVVAISLINFSEHFANRMVGIHCNESVADNDTGI